MATPSMVFYHQFAEMPGSTSHLDRVDQPEWSLNVQDQYDFFAQYSE